MAAPFKHNAHSRLARDLGWPRLPPEIRLYRASMAATDSRGLIYLAHRGENPLLCLNPDGTLRRVVGAGVLRKSVYYNLSGPKAVPLEEAYYLHGLHVDPWDNVWVTDVGRHLVFRFNPEGDLTLSLGEDGQPGGDERRFNQPTHAVVAPSGEIYVADGYGNSRIARFGRDGRFIQEWGRRGSEPGEFNTPHVIVIDPKGRLVVSDRENDRIQVFDPEGRLLEVWPGLHSIDGLCLGPDGGLWACSGVDHTILRLDWSGRPTEIWEDASKTDYPDRVQLWPDGNIPHGIWVSPEGTIYVSEVTCDKNPASPLFRVGRLLKLKRVELGQAEAEGEPDRLAGKGAQV